MHKILPEKLHGVIDYFTVVLFLVSPTLFGLIGASAVIAYTLAVVHLLMSVSTRFSFGVFNAIGFKLHGLIELLVSVVLVAYGLVLLISDNSNGALFYISIGLVIFIVWLLSDYTSVEPKDNKPLNDQ